MLDSVSPPTAGATNANDGRGLYAAMEPSNVCYSQCSVPSAVCAGARTNLILCDGLLNQRPALLGFLKHVPDVAVFHISAQFLV